MWIVTSNCSCQYCSLYTHTHTLVTYSASSVSLTVRTCLIDVPVSNSAAAQMMESLICPAPSSLQPELSKEKLQQLIVPTPGCKTYGTIHI